MMLQKIFGIALREPGCIHVFHTNGMLGLHCQIINTSLGHSMLSWKRKKGSWAHCTVFVWLPESWALCSSLVFSPSGARVQPSSQSLTTIEFRQAQCLSCKFLGKHSQYLPCRFQARTPLQKMCSLTLLSLRSPCQSAQDLSKSPQCSATLRQLSSAPERVGSGLRR